MLPSSNLTISPFERSLRLTTVQVRTRGLRKRRLQSSSLSDVMTHHQCHYINGFSICVYTWCEINESAWSRTAVFLFANSDYCLRICLCSLEEQPRWIISHDSVVYIALFGRYFIKLCFKTLVSSFLLKLLSWRPRFDCGEFEL